MMTRRRLPMRCSLESAHTNHNPLYRLYGVIDTPEFAIFPNKDDFHG